MNSKFLERIKQISKEPKLMGIRPKKYEIEENNKIKQKAIKSYKQGLKEGKKIKKRKEKLEKRLARIIKTKPKKFILKRDRATIDLRKLPQPPKKPLLSQHSNYFKSEYEKEKKLLGWK